VSVPGGFLQSNDLGVASSGGPVLKVCGTCGVVHETGRCRAAGRINFALAGFSPLPMRSFPFCCGVLRQARSERTSLPACLRISQRLAKAEIRSAAPGLCFRIVADGSSAKLI